MNKIKNILIVLVLFTTTAFYAQDEKYEKIKSLKVAFITEKLDLTSSEAQAFWPIYNAYEEKMHDCRNRDRSEIRGKLKNFDAVSEKEAAEMLVKIEAIENEKNTERKAYFKKISNILSAKKTILLMNSEEDFKRELIKKYHGKSKSGGSRP